MRRGDKNMYKWDAEDYHKSSFEQQKWAKELILKLALKGNERVLDIGCGDGKISAEIAEKLPRGSILGIDSSFEMISFAKDNFSSKNLAFQLQDARGMNFISEFDVVFSTSTLHWVIDHLPVLKGIKRSLKPGGRILLQMAGKGNAAKIIEVSETIVNSKRWNEYFTDFAFPWGFYGTDEYNVWLKDVGLKVKRVELIPKDMIHKGKEGLSGWIRTTWLPYTQRLPEELRDEFIGEIVDKYIKDYPPDNKGFIHIQMMRLEVEAEKL
ncbi:MAG: methyltransferase domain-containing protein [bacterium]